MKGKKIALLVALLVLAAVVVICAVTLGGGEKTPDEDGMTAPASQTVSEWTTQDRREDLRFRSGKTLAVTDGAEDEPLSVDLPAALDVCRVSDSELLFAAPDGVGALKTALESLTPEDASYRCYLYDDAHMRIDKNRTDGTTVSFCAVRTKTEDDRPIYCLSDCTAAFVDGTGQESVKFPFFYLSPAESFDPLDYGVFGKTYQIAVQKQDFYQYYSDTRCYLLQDEGSNSFVLAGEYTDAQTKKLGLRFLFERDADQKMTVRIERAD